MDYQPKGKLWYTVRMKKILFAFLSVTIVCGAEEKPLPVWRMPQVWPRHVQLRQQLIDVIRRGDAAKMEEICREALNVIPGDATWHYNLACALAKRAAPSALDELDKAIEFGFHDADSIAKDADFAGVRENPRFAELVEKARSLKGKPGRGHPDIRPSVVMPGSTLTLNDTNMAWNFNIGVFETRFNIVEPVAPISSQANSFKKSTPNSPERSNVIEWISNDTAAGNIGDVYVNRDLGHSQLNVGDFPGIVNVKYCSAAHAAKLDVDHPNTLFPNCAVFLNISRARTKGPFWRSTGRASFTDPGLAPRMDLLYLNNQLLVVPAHMDYGKKDIGDVFPGAAPFHLVSVGSSWSDQPFLRAALAASASFTRQTKQSIIRRHLMGPTLQWLLRRTRRNIDSEADYLSPLAHPTAFESRSLDTMRLVEKAHSLRPEQIPPVALLNIINSRLQPIRYPVAGRDYPDTAPEILYATTSAICVVLRALEGERTFLFRARAFGTDGNASFTWRVVHGDASAVKIQAPAGETNAIPEKGFAQITIDRRNIKERIDVACFAKTDDTEWGAPSFVSFFPIPQEAREYRPDGKIKSIDYSNPEGVYSDPAVALPRHWKDTYSYDENGKMLGWTRSYNGRDTASFTAAGDRIVERNADGKPTKAVHVRYAPRSSSDKLEPLVLSYLDDGEPFDVK